MKKENSNFYTLQADPVFKNVFYRDYNLLKRFLSDILSIFYDDVTINKVKVLNTELTKDRLYIKNKVVDILVDIGSKVLNIEVNVKYDNYRIYRNFFYLASSTIESMKKDKKFVDVKEHVQFNFNFKKGKKKGFKISQYGDLSSGEVTIPFMKTIDIDVDYYKDKWYNSGKSKEYYEQFKSIIMFGLSENELKNLEDSDDYMKKIKDDVVRLNGDPNFYQVMTDDEDREMIENSIKIVSRREGLEQGLEQGLQQGLKQGLQQGIEQGTRRGIEQGSKETKINIVKNMKEADYKIEEIEKITGLSIEEIEKI